MIRIFRLLLIVISAVSVLQAGPLSVSSLGIRIGKEPRQFVMTNKEAGIYYGEARSKNSGGWFGWFVNAEKILHDYELSVGGRTLDRSASRVTVYPHQTTRLYANGTRETFTMADSLDLLIIEVRSRSPRVALTMALPDQFSRDTMVQPPFQAWKKPSPGTASSGVPQAIYCAPYRTTEGTVFIVSAAGSIDEARGTADSAFTHRHALASARQRRMDDILDRAAIDADNARLTRAFAWAVLQMDALIMRQRVNGVPTKGIFAGLPWFNNYWGRDSFISLPGATYVTGNFSDAKDVLRSYAAFQQMDTASANYGRIPNLATPTSVQYNTADGTPWFVRGVWEYVRASNDTAFLREMYPVIVRANEGTLRYHTDSLMFLTHADAETWMDAVGPEGSWSPRGTRANDIQALWYEQLELSSFIAAKLGDQLRHETWGKYRGIVQKNFQRLFVDSARGLIYDHLKKDGSASTELRPNQLFCLDMIGSRDVRRHVTKNVLSGLVYEHGTGTLSQLDSNFTPYHHYEPFYVQDAAYHNGIVWTWLNGAAVSAAARFFYQDAVYPVTLNMVHQILERGCVGALSELLDAHARPGEREPRLSGTYSQAWSLAEFLRSMYEDYLGARVLAESHTIWLAPRLPSKLKEVAFTLTTPDGPVHVRYRRKGEALVISVHSEARTPYIIFTDKHEIDPSLENRTVDLAGRADAAGTRDAEIRIAPSGRYGLADRHVPPLARPVLVPYLKALKGPPYPLLSMKEAGAKNPRAHVLIDAQDPIGDDRGLFGTYVYPSTVHLKPGSLDITQARISHDEKNMYVSLTFSALSDPGWHPEYGFQLTLAAIAIHRSGEDTAVHVGVNSMMRLDPARAFSRMLVVGGGYRLTDEKSAVLCEYRPRAEDVKHPIGSIVTQTVNCAVPLAYLGTPSKDWKFTIMIGAQDDHGGAGVGEFRAVNKHGGEWTGGGKDDPSQPNIYDMLTTDR